MIPIGDQNVRGAATPWVKYVLMLINGLVFLYQLTLSPPELNAFLFRWGAVPAQIMQGQELVTVVTSTFLHGGWFHLITNMIFLSVFGDNIEAVYGHLGFLIFYLAGGVIATLAHAFFNMGSEIPSVGASGSIAAILGSYIVLFPRSRVRVLLILGIFITITRVTAVIVLGLWALLQFFNAFAQLTAETAQTAGVAYWAHIGGFVFGLVVGLLLRGRADRVELEWVGR
ncbi:MAG TPA: rhomboid family intramembrane serine protease [Chloroflexi bacterium]|jgi:membrane associated rhomboid family serine protease|nr:rhomboid family intramembrane serine protease [Chloroflexota bacterium]